MSCWTRGVDKAIHSIVPFLFPFDCGRWFARYVVDDTADAFDFVDDSR